MADHLVELRVIKNGAPAPLLFAEEHALVVSYWDKDEPPYHPTTAPITLVRFHGPRWHQFGPPTEDAMERHPLGLESRTIYEVRDSSLIRRLAAIEPAQFENVNHYIMTFQDSTLECVAAGFHRSIENIGWNEQYPLMLEALAKRDEAAE